MYDKGKAGSVVETETVLAEKIGEVYSKAVGSTFFGKTSFTLSLSETHSMASLSLYSRDAVRSRYLILVAHV